MRHLVLGTLLLAGCAWLAFDQQPVSIAADVPDSPGAKATREKKLKLKLKVDYDMKFLDEIMTELPDLVNAAGGGTLRIKALPGAGVTVRSRFTIKGEMTLEEILEAIIKDKNWGWYVVSTKVGDQNDGAIFITTNPKEHGYKEGTGPMGKEVAKKDDMKDKPKDKTKEEPKTGGDERAAQDLLMKGKFLKSTKQLDKAKAAFEELISKFPDSKAATEAKKLLEMIGK